MLGILPLFVFAWASFASPQDSSAPDRKPDRLRDLSDINARKVTLTLSESPVREGLKQLFTQVELNRIVILNVDAPGRLTFSVKDAPFEGALVSIVKGSRRAQYAYSDLNGMLLICPAAMQTGIAGGAADRKPLRVSMDVQDGDIRYLIKAMMQPLRTNYSLDQEVSGKVSVVFENLTYDEALERVLKAEKTPITFHVEDGIYRFERAPR